MLLCITPESPPTRKLLVEQHPQTPPQASSMLLRRSFPRYCRQSKITLVFSLYIRLFWSCHGIRNPGTEAVRYRVQAVPMRCPGRREGVSLPVHCGHLPALRRAAPVPAFRDLARKAEPHGCEAGASRGTLKCSTPVEPCSFHSECSFALAPGRSRFVVRSTPVPAF